MMNVAEPLAPSHRVGPRDAGMLMTPEEFDAIDEWNEEFRYELVHGVLIVTPPAGIGERSPNDELGYLLRLFRDSHPNGALIDATAPEQTVKTPSNRRRTDRAIWIGFGRKPDSQQDTPTIVVEFTSSRARDRRRDYIEKRQEYARTGIREYWVIDRFRRMMTVFRGEDAEIVLQANDVYRTDLLPGFELPVARLLVEVEFSDEEREADD
jgi:Uma2 family endonuclease